MARGVSRQVRLSQERAERAWAAAAAAVEQLCGAPPPTEPGVLRGGRRHDQAAVLRRKYALYTAIVGLDVHASHVARFAGVRRQWVSEEVLPELERLRDRPEVDFLLDELRAIAAAEMVRASPRPRAA